MKKEKLNPLELDKETIARLDEAQLKKIIGGGYDAIDDADESACHTVSCMNVSCGNARP